MMACKISAVVRVDQRAVAHAEAYNARYAAYLLRRRLARVAIPQEPRGFMGQRVPDATAEDLAGFVQPRLLGEFIMRTPSTGDRALLQIELGRWRETVAKGTRCPTPDFHSK